MKLGPLSITRKQQDDIDGQTVLAVHWCTGRTSRRLLAAYRRGRRCHDRERVRAVERVLEYREVLLENGEIETVPRELLREKFQWGPVEWRLFS